MNLCAIPGCRIHGRHLPGCDGDDCQGCLPRATEDGHACDVCVGRAAARLETLIELTPDARLVASGLVRRGSGGNSGKPGSRPPINDGAMDAMDEIQNAITTIARDIAETRGLQIDSAAYGDLSPVDPLTRAAKWLTGQLDWLRHATDDQGEAYAVGVFAELGENAARIRGLLDGPAAQRYLGPCGAETPIGTLSQPDLTFTCEGDVYGRVGAAKGTCRTCGAQVDQDERRAWLDDQVRQYAYTAKEIADAYGINVKTIRTWHTRGHLAQHGIDRDGVPLHNLGDVLDLAAGDAARREERRADRERRAERMSA